MILLDSLAVNRAMTLNLLLIRMSEFVVLHDTGFSGRSAKVRTATCVQNIPS